MPWRFPLHQTRLAKLADILTTLLCLGVTYAVWALLNHLAQGRLGFHFVVSWDHVLVAAVVATVTYFSMAMQNAYAFQRFTSFKTELKIIIRSILLIGFSIPVTAFIFRVSYIPRSFIALYLVILLSGFILQKRIIFAVATWVRRRGGNRKKALLVGTNHRTHEFIDILKKNPGWGLDITGCLTTDPLEMGSDLDGLLVIGTVDQVHDVLHRFPVEEVIVTLSTEEFEAIREVVTVCEEEGVRVHLISDFFGQIVKQVHADFLYGLPVMTMSMTHEKPESLFLKRVMDVAISLFLMIVLSPFLILIAFLIKLTSKGPVLYRWNVVGFNKKPIQSWKFRTMVVNADELKPALAHLNEMNGPVFKIKNDPRITRLGHFLRKYSLDELPQLVSVLKGDLSLVGPRPAGPHELERYENWQRRKLSIKPGLTCLWQISGRNSIADFDEWVKMDLQYIDTWSLKLDFKILLKTIPVVISGKGAS